MGKIHSSSVNRKKPLVGVTGIIGSGKTTVSQLFGKLGAVIFDADVTARKVTENKQVIQKIGKSFGKQVIDANQSLDRRKLANIVFNDKEKLIQLNNIVHPLVREEMWSFVEAKQQWDEVPMIIIDSPLIYETNLYTFLDYVVVVSANVQTIIERVQKRSGLSRMEIKDRLSDQIPIEEKIHKANFCIDNTKDIKIIDNLYCFRAIIGSIPNQFDPSHQRGKRCSELVSGFFGHSNP